MSGTDVGGDAAFDDVQAGSRRELDPRGGADADHHEVGGDVLAVSQPEAGHALVSLE